MRTSGEIDFRFRLKLKITFVESTYPSQRPECPSLSPHFLLVIYTSFLMNGDFPIQFSVYTKLSLVRSLNSPFFPPHIGAEPVRDWTKLSHTTRILSLGSLCVELALRIQNGGFTTQHDTDKRRESFLIWPIFDRNCTFKWVIVSIFHLILCFFHDSRRSESIRVDQS